MLEIKTKNRGKMTAILIDLVVHSKQYANKNGCPFSN